MEMDGRMEAYRDEKVADGRGEVQKPARAEGVHELRDASELVEVVGDADKGEDEEAVGFACVAVLAEDVEHLGGVIVAGNDRAVGAFLEEVEEAVGRVAVVAGEGEEGELAVPESVSVSIGARGREYLQEQNCISRFQKVLCASLGHVSLRAQSIQAHDRHTAPRVPAEKLSMNRTVCFSSILSANNVGHILSRGSTHRAAR